MYVFWCKTFVWHDVITWKHALYYWPIVSLICRSPMDPPTNGSIMQISDVLVVTHPNKLFNEQLSFRFFSTPWRSRDFTIIRWLYEAKTNYVYSSIYTPDILLYIINAPTVKHLVPPGSSISGCLYTFDRDICNKATNSVINRQAFHVKNCWYLDANFRKISYHPVYLRSICNFAPKSRLNDEICLKWTNRCENNGEIKVQLIPL